MAWNYDEIKRALAAESLPAMLVDLDSLDANIARIRETVEASGKRLRLATKSVRVPKLIRYIVDKGGPAFQGLMCYSVGEAQFLAREGFDDLLVAYPTVAAQDLAAVASLAAAGKRITLMVDEEAHVAAIEATAGRNIGVCIDADMSYRPFGMHLGVYRSPVRSIADFERLAKRILSSKCARLAGVMGYEAQIAGVGDRNPFTPLLNPIVRLMKRFSGRDVARRRGEIAAWCEREGVKLDLFNGGGTGSLATTSKEQWITEVTAGSGFLQSHLFDYYRGNRSVPAFAFALAVTRVPEPGTVTCQSGGFIASGASGPDKAPIPFLPVGLTPLKDEGFGEVQTPFRHDASLSLRPGDPVLVRPAKAGEIAERFGHYCLLRKGVIVDRVPTYRGAGHSFY